MTSPTHLARRTRTTPLMIAISSLLADALELALAQRGPRASSRLRVVLALGARGVKMADTRRATTTRWTSARSATTAAPAAEAAATAVGQRRAIGAWQELTDDQHGERERGKPPRRGRQTHSADGPTHRAGDVDGYGNAGRRGEAAAAAGARDRASTLRQPREVGARPSGAARCDSPSGLPCATAVRHATTTSTTIQSAQRAITTRRSVTSRRRPARSTRARCRRLTTRSIDDAEAAAS